MACKDVLSGSRQVPSAQRPSPNNQKFSGPLRPLPPTPRHSKQDERINIGENRYFSNGHRKNSPSPSIATTLPMTYDFQTYQKSRLEDFNENDEASNFEDIDTYETYV